VPEHLVTLDAARELLPMWTDWGVQDSQVWVHSLGVSLRTLRGHQLGHVAMCEAPAPSGAPHSEAGVRLDSIWIDRQTRRPLLLAEFERYEGPQDSAKLNGKIQNLLIAHRRWGESASILALSYWTKGLAALPPHAEFRRLFRDGFTTAARERVAGSAKGQLLFFQFVLSEGQDNCLRLTRIIPRGEV
jgi:hypothetical protein